MRIAIVTGMSGAGKTSALRMLEDVGYYCVDNMPIALIQNFAKNMEEEAAKEEARLLLENKSEKKHHKSAPKVALGIDIRSGHTLKNLDDVIVKLKMQGHTVEILFLDASTPVLVKRYKETRRNHPLAKVGRIDGIIDSERESLDFLKKKADYIIDTSTLLTRELKIAIEDIFVGNKRYKNMYITIVSFGFKYGIPSDADMIFDVRFLPNPYYIPELKPKTGNEQDVQDFVMRSDSAHEFLDKLTAMCKFLIPNYVSEGKYQLVIGIGCTGGKHRSVTIANALFDRLKDMDYGIKVEHRDIEKDAIRAKKNQG